MGISRSDLWRLVKEAPGPVVPPMLMAAYELELHREWSKGDRSPHGHAWHTSFHASEFPGQNKIACGRLAVYNLLDPPSEKPHPPFLQAWFDLGSNLEHDWVRRLNAAGVLLSADVTAGAAHQTGFRDDEHWFTGSSDAIVLVPERMQGHCVEVKTTSHEKVLKMLNSGEVPKQHGKYLRQLGAYIGLAHEAPFSPEVVLCQKSMRLCSPIDGAWVCPCRRLPTDRPSDLTHDGECAPASYTVRPPDDGTLIYSSREEPLTVASFNVAYDPAFMSEGRAKLAAWKQAFLEGKIPEHPHEHAKAKWSVDPCQYCPLKAEVCKLDYSQKVTDLRRSNLIGFATRLRPGWNYNSVRSAVLQRWDEEDREQREELTTA